jgi:hypothetical protein
MINLRPLPRFILPVLLTACGEDIPVGQDDTGSSTATTAPTTGDTPTGTTLPGTSTGDDPTTEDPSTGNVLTTDDSTGTTATTTVDPDTGATTVIDTTGDDTTASSSDDTGDSSTGEMNGWQKPACDSVTGTGAVTFSADLGTTLAPMDQVIVPVHYTFGLVALGKPGAMLAGSGGQILASDDAGCSWHSIGEASGGNTPAVRLVAAGDTRAYGFGDNDSVLVRVDDEVITKLGSPAGQEGIVGLGVDPDDPDHVRIGDTMGRLWDSTNAGLKFDLQGTPAPANSWAYRAAFDAHDLDHVVFGVISKGAYVTTDAGGKWTQSTGLSAKDNANGFHVVVSPVQGDVVWLEGYDLSDNDDAKARHIYRSEDGGLTFTPVVDSDEATLYNGNHLFAHPTDPDVLYFVFGSNFQGYGTDLYRYDHAAGKITLTHNMWHDTVITFLPGDPSWIYLGLSIEP